MWPSITGICASISTRSKFRAGGEDVHLLLAVLRQLRGDTDRGEQAFDHIPVEGLVIDHQHACVLVAHVCRLLPALCGGRQFAGLAQTQPEPDVEGAAGALAAGDADVAAHQLGQALADCQPETGAAEPARGSGSSTG